MSKKRHPIFTGSAADKLDGTENFSAGGAGGAPTTAEYLVGALDATLSAERLVTDTATITWDVTVAGQAKANVVGGSGVGARGAPGEDGDIGEEGLQGIRGTDGISGCPGSPGMDGLDGDEGRMGVPGIQGLAGSDGTPADEDELAWLRLRVHRLSRAMTLFGIDIEHDAFLTL